MKKRILSLLCVAAMLVAVLAPVCAMAESKAYVYTSNQGPLNLRKAPVTHANNKVAGIPYGSEVTVHEYVNNGTWAYVSYESYTGYVMTRYLTNTKPASTPASTTEPTAETINFGGFTQTSYSALVRAHTPGGYVNMRWAPSLSVKVYEKVNDGTVLEVIAENHSWAQVRDNATGRVGFMARSFLTVVNDNSAPAIGTGATAN